jgi:hypothetical protein
MCYVSNCGTICVMFHTVKRYVLCFTLCDTPWLYHDPSSRSNYNTAHHSLDVLKELKWSFSALYRQIFNDGVTLPSPGPRRDGAWCAQAWRARANLIHPQQWPPARGVGRSGSAADALFKRQPKTHRLCQYRQRLMPWASFVESTSWCMKIIPEYLWKMN